MSKPLWIDVAVQTPAHSQVGGLLSYRSALPLSSGQLIRVPFGQREVLGVVWHVHETAPSDMPLTAIREVSGILAGLASLDDAWR